MACLILLAACNRAKRDEDTPPPVSTPAPAAVAPTSASTAAPEPAPRAPEISLADIGLVHPEVPEKLDEHGWDTEHINETAGHQLKALAKLMTTPTELTADALSSFLAPGFRSTPLRPGDLAPVFSEGEVTVRRATRPLTEAADPVSADGFARLLQELASPAPAADEITANFKVFRVSAEPDAAETTVRAERVARGGGRAIQQTAQWRCRWRRVKDEDPQLLSVVVEAFEETEARMAGGYFSDVTAAVIGADPAFREQLAFNLDHWVARIEQQFVSGPSGWEGMAMGDANGDGRDDLYVCQPGGLPNRLFLQNADGTLTDRARESGVDWWDQSQAALFCDFDNDGDQDLAIALMWGVLFMANDGQGHFAVAAARLSPEGIPHSLAAADFDADGDLDVYVCCYAKRANALEDRFLARPIPYHDASNGSRNILLRNDRQWRFRDATKAVGLDENNRRFSFAAAWEDFDGDGDLDLYVANDFGRNNLYRCDRSAEGAIQFRDVAAAAGVEDISAGMSASWGDADNDGRPDLYVSNMWSSAGNRIAYQRRFREGGDAGSLPSFQRHARGNSLFVNAGDGTFADVSEPAGVTMGRWAWGSRFVDLNNDGWEDLVVANGYITQPDPGDL